MKNFETISESTLLGYALTGLLIRLDVEHEILSEKPNNRIARHHADRLIKQIEEINLRVLELEEEEEEL